MEIVTGSTGEVHVTPIDDAVRNSNVGYLNDKVVFTCFDNFAATVITNNEVRISSGYGINQGRIFKIDDQEYDSVTIENGSQGYKRADLIVARYTMDTQTGFEDISLEVIRGNSGSTYIDPSYSTGDINGGDIQDDFPLYRVKLNGLNIEAVESMFTLVPDGGRMGELEAQVRAHKTAFDALNVRTNLASESAVYLKNGANARPGVEGILPVSHGGTGQTSLKAGATSLIDALDSNATVPADGDYYVGTTPSTAGYQRKSLSALWSWISSKLGSMGYGDMTKGEFCNNPDSEAPTVKIEKGGTGQTTLNGVRNALGLGNDVTKPLPYDKGGTGIIQKPSILVNLASESATDVYQATPRPGVTGILPVKHGGTGNTSLQATRNAMGLGNTTGALPIANGGTGATSASAARTNLGTVAKAGDTFTGNIRVDRGGSDTDEHWTRLFVGNEKAVGTAGNQVGVLALYAANGKQVDLVPSSNSAEGSIRLPATTGTLALTSQLASYMPKTGGTFTGIVEFNNDATFGTNSNVNIRHYLWCKEGAFDELIVSNNSNDAWLIVGDSEYNNGHLCFRQKSSSFDLNISTGTKLTDERTVKFPNSDGTIQVSSPSSRRIKENIKDMSEDKAKKLLEVNVVDFDYIGEFGGGLKNQCGVIAEDTLDIIPEAVEIEEGYDETKPIDKENTAPSVDYRKFIPYLIKMVQMQQKEIEELKAALAK